MRIPRKIKKKYKKMYSKKKGCNIKVIKSSIAYCHTDKVWGCIIEPINTIDYDGKIRERK